MHVLCQSSMATKALTAIVVSTTELTFWAMPGKCTACYWLLMPVDGQADADYGTCAPQENLCRCILGTDAPVSVTICPMLPDAPDAAREEAREEAMLENVRCSVALLHCQNPEASPRNGAACPAQCLLSTCPRLL